MKRKSLDRRLAKLDPQSVFESPLDVVRETLLTKGEKLGTLDRWRLAILDKTGSDKDAKGITPQLLHQIEEAKNRLTGARPHSVENFR